MIFFWATDRLVKTQVSHPKIAKKPLESQPKSAAKAGLR